MYPQSFEYHSPESVDEAVSLLGTLGDDAKLLAGGHSLIPLMKLRFATPAHLVDVRRISELAGIREESGALVIGAATTYARLDASDAVRKHVPILAEAARKIGDPLVRNMGTLGGSLAHADPAADLTAVVLALGATLDVAGPKGKRSIEADQFFTGLLTTALAPTEVLTAVRVPIPTGKTGGAYEKHPHPASRYAIVGVAAVATLGKDGKVAEVRVAVTGLAPSPYRANAVEKALAGSSPGDAPLDAAVRRVADGVEVRGDLQAPAEYKKHLAVVHARRAIARALERAAARK